MNSTPTPKAIEPHNAQIAGADEQLAHAHEEIGRAGEELTRLSEQLAKMERDAAPPPSPAPSGVASSPPSPAPSAEPVPQSPPGRPARRVLIGLPIAACIVVAVLALQSSYGARAKLVVARWAPQLVATPSLHQENAPLAAQPAPAVVRVAAAEAAPPQATPLAQTAPQDAAPTATAAPPDQTQLLQTMARDLANMERSIEQLKANQQQTASDTSKAIEALKASQEEIKRSLAKVSEQNPPKTSSAPTPPTPALRKPERTLPSPYARVRPRMPREWIYDDDQW
jgi:gas vesicle protein